MDKDKLDKDKLKSIEVVVRVWVSEDADVTDLVNEMWYDFAHPAIKLTEIVDFCDEV